MQLRSDIVQMLDESAHVSFLESAHFRIELMVALDSHEKHLSVDVGTLTSLRDLHHRVKAIAVPTM